MQRYTCLFVLIEPFVPTEPTLEFLSSLCARHLSVQFGGIFLESSSSIPPPQVTQLAGYFEPLVKASVGVASKLEDHQQQMTFLDQTKTMAESALQMLYAAKEGGGNPKVEERAGGPAQRWRRFCKV